LPAGCGDVSAATAAAAAAEDGRAAERRGRVGDGARRRDGRGLLLRHLDLDLRQRVEEAMTVPEHPWILLRNTSLTVSQSSKGKLF
jgi:hypothetical protein